MKKDKSNNSIEELKITSQYPLIKQNPSILKNLLLPLELHCLKTMIYEQIPLSTRFFYSGCIKSIFLENVQSYEYELIKKMPNSLFSKFKVKSIDIYNGLKEERKNRHITFPESIEKSILNSRSISKRLNRPHPSLSETNKILIKEIILKKFKIPFPSYGKIKNSLDFLWRTPPFICRFGSFASPRSRLDDKIF